MSAKMVLADEVYAAGQRIDTARDALREIDSSASTDEIGKAVETAACELGNAHRLAWALSRLVKECSTEQIYRAFDAPGYWGYDTPIGDALYKLYSAPREATNG